MDIMLLLAAKSIATCGGVALLLVFVGVVVAAWIKRANGAQNARRRDWVWWGITALAGIAALWWGSHP